jgi:hypothetical protein
MSVTFELPAIDIPIPQPLDFGCGVAAFSALVPSTTAFSTTTLLASQIRSMV